MHSASNEGLTLAAFDISILFGGMNATGVRFAAQEVSPMRGAWRLYDYFSVFD